MTERHEGLEGHSTLMAADGAGFVRPMSASQTPLLPGQGRRAIPGPGERRPGEAFDYDLYLCVSLQMIAAKQCVSMRCCEHSHADHDEKP